MPPAGPVLPGHRTAIVPAPGAPTGAASPARDPCGRQLSGVGCQGGGPDDLPQFVETRVVTEHTLRHGFASSLDEGPPAA
jgi:hypothetical protein